MARPPGRKELWEGTCGDVGNSKTKSGLTRSEGGITQEGLTKQRAPSGAQSGSTIGTGVIADMGWGITLMDR